MSLDPSGLRRVASHFATGVTIVSAELEGRPCGLTANAFMTVSLEPPLVLVSISRGSRSLPCVEAAARFGVSVLGADQQELSRLFASKDEGKFSSIRTHRGPAGVPLVDGAVAYLECRTTRRFDAGDHVLFLGEVESAEARGGPALVFHRGRYHSLSDDA